jgi:hypothetical protein
VSYRKVLLVILVVGLSCLIGCGKSVSFLVSGNRVVVMPFWDNGQSEGFDLRGHTVYTGSITQNGETHHYYFSNIERDGDTLYDDIISFDLELDGKNYSYP